MWDAKYLIWFGLICVAFWIVEKFILSRRTNSETKSNEGTGNEVKKSKPVDLEQMLEGAELAAFIRNEKLFLTTDGQWLFIQRLKDRLNYSTFTPWEARNYILDCMQKKERDTYVDKKAEVLKKYNLKGDKNDLHLPYVDRMFRGKMMIKN